MNKEADQGKKFGVAYLRISDKKQIEGESSETQRRVIQDYADRNNIEIIKWFYDEAKSGRNTERDELKKLLSFVAKNAKKIDFMVVYKLSRASRDLLSYMTTIKAFLSGRGISIRSATEPIDDSPLGRLMEGIFLLNGQFDNEVKGSQTLDNMKSLASQGYWMHGPILGYDKFTIKNELGKPRPTLKPNSKALLVKQVLERFSERDMTQADLVTFANKIGLRTRRGRKLGKHAIASLIRRPEYAGYVHGKLTDGQLIEGKHEAIISKETFEINQKILNGRKSLKKQYSKRNESYPLKGTLLCSTCKKHVYGSAPRTGGQKSHSERYHCSRSNCLRLGKKSIKTNEAEQAFMLLLEQIQPSEGILRLYKEILVRQSIREGERLNATVKASRNKLQDLTDSRMKAIEERLESNDQKVIGQLSELIDHIDQKKLDVQMELDDLVERQSIQESKIEYATRFMSNVAKQWTDADYDLKLKFQSMIFPRGVVFNMETKEFGTEKISPLYRFVPNKKDLSNVEKSSLVTPRGIEPRFPG